MPASRCRPTKSGCLGFGSGSAVFLKQLQGDFNVWPGLRTTHHLKNKSFMVQLLMSEVQLRGRLISILTATTNTGHPIPHPLANSKLHSSNFSGNVCSCFLHHLFPGRKHRQGFWNPDILEEFSLRNKRMNTVIRMLSDFVYVVKTEVN